MPLVQAFEPAMCCSTGVCGPSVDPVLVRFAADVEWLKSKGAQVERANLSQQPQAFVASAKVREAMQQSMDCLPMVLVDGEVFTQGFYPTREQLADRLGLDPADDFDFLPMA